MKLLQSCLAALCLFAVAAMNTNTARNPVELASRVAVLSSVVGSVLCQDSPGNPPSTEGLRVQSPRVPRVHGKTIDGSKIDGSDLFSEEPTSNSGSNDDPERPTCGWNNAAPGCPSDQTLPTGKDDGIQHPTRKNVVFFLTNASNYHVSELVLTCLTAAWALDDQTPLVKKIFQR